MGNAKTDFDRFMEDEESRRLFIQERTIGELTEMICRELRRQQITQAELARRMGRTKGQVSQMLNGARNLTLRSLSDMLQALGKSLEPLLRPAECPPGRYMRIPDGEDWVRGPQLQVDVDEPSGVEVSVSEAPDRRGAA